MNATAWAMSYQLISKENQGHMVEAIESLQRGRLGQLGDYDQEAFAKTFCEGIVYLESSLLHGAGIHPRDLDVVGVSMNPNDYAIKIEEIERTIKVSIQRQKRLYSRMILAI